MAGAPADVVETSDLEGDTVADPLISWVAWVSAPT